MQKELLDNVILILLLILINKTALTSVLKWSICLINIFND